MRFILLFAFFIIFQFTEAQNNIFIFDYESAIPNQERFDKLEDAYQIMDIFNKALATTKDTTTLKQDIEVLKKPRKIAKKQEYTRKRYERYRYATFPSQRAIIKKAFEYMYANLTIPTFYIIGANDIFVDPVSEVEKLKLLENKNVKIKVFNGLNHYLTTEPEDELGKEMYHMDQNASYSIIKWIKSI